MQLFSNTFIFIGEAFHDHLITKCISFLYFLAVENRSRKTAEKN